MNIDPVYAGVLSVVPPLVAIAFALIFKEILSSLLLGIFSGTLIYSFVSGSNFMHSIELVFELMFENLSSNSSVIIFTSFLGAVSQIMIDSGGAAGFTHWAEKKIKSSKSAQLFSVFLSFICSIDDTFLCLTTGSVMLHTIQKQKVSRARFSYILDMMSSQLAILFPISSWSVAIASCISSAGLPGIELFIKSIPFNFYAIFSVLLAVFSSLINKNFKIMNKFEVSCENGKDISLIEKSESSKINTNGTVWDLIIPMLSLIIGALFIILQTGGAFSGQTDIFEIIRNANIDLSLNFGSMLAILISIFLFVPRKIKFDKFMDSACEGIKSITFINSMLILAWSITFLCKNGLSTGEFMRSIISSCNFSESLIPFSSFLLSTLLAFSIGSSWATFGILIPIISSIVSGMDEKIIVLSISGILSGSIAGVNLSPISSASLLASASAHCKHFDHVSSQIPYVLLASAVSSIGFLIAPIIDNSIILHLILISGLFISYYFLTYNKSAYNGKNK